VRHEVSRRSVALQMPRTGETNYQRGVICPLERDGTLFGLHIEGVQIRLL
jgi:hypothetical protein